MASSRFVEALQLLAQNDVEYIVVGMLSAVMQGVPAMTVDIDLVHRRTPENVERLLRVLRHIHGVSRGDPRRISPDESHLIGPGQILLETDLGDLDCLGTVDDGKTYEDLYPDSVELDLGGGLTTRVVELEVLVGMKERAGRPKDLAMLHTLRATIEERARQRGRQPR